MAKSRVPYLRVLLLTAITITALGTGGAYLARSRRAAQNRQAPPVRIPSDVNQSAQGFSMSKTDGKRTLFKVTARKAVDFRETGKSELEDVEIEIFGATGDRSDHIRSKHCLYDSKANRIFSEGEVEIELASLPGQAPLPAPLRRGSPMWVKTSGLLFDQETQVATTDKELSFRFDQGKGQSHGAVYDSRAQSLVLKQGVQLSIEKRDPPVEMRAAEMRYLQKENQLRMTHPELRREGQSVTADEGVVFLDDHRNAKSATLTGHIQGTDTSNGRDSQFAADRLELTLDDRQQVTFATATGNVSGANRSRGGRSEGHAARLEMDFTGPEGSLRTAEWKGQVRMIFHPDPAQPKGQTKTVTSEQVEMVMQPGGRELATARTLAPGRLEISGGGEPRRVLTANNFRMEFGAKDQVKQLRAQGQVRSESEVEQRAGSKPAPPRITTSDQLVADFTADTQQIETVEQSGHFTYQEGDRQGKGDRATYQASTTTTVLVGGKDDPQFWDPTGRVIAKRITINDKTGEALAEQDVRATQIPSDNDKSSALLAGTGQNKKDPLHATTDRLRWDRKAGISHYEGGPGGRARLWQGQDFLEARTVDMDRPNRKVTASGDVYSFLVQEGKEPMRITAENLVYTDGDRRAHYERQVVMKSQDMVATSAALDAYLSPPEASAQQANSQSRLERAVATGNVHMNQPARPAQPGHKAVPARRGEAERGEYSAQEDKVILSGGQPKIYDDVRGTTSGRELTYFIADDRILVVGDENLRTLSEHRVTKKPR